MKNLGIQLLTIRAFLRDEEQIKRSFDALASYGYNEVETAGFPVEPLRMAELAREAGLRIVSTHYDWDKIVSEPDAMVELRKAIGASFVGLTGRAQTWESPESLAAFTSEVNAFAKKCGDAGLKFVYHNHSNEFTRFDGDSTHKYARFME